MVLDALRSDYRHRPDAALFARQALDMAALVDPEALDGWDSRSASIERLDTELRDLLDSIKWPSPCRLERDTACEE